MTLQDFPALVGSNGRHFAEDWIISFATGKIFRCGETGAVNIEASPEFYRFIKARADEGSEFHKQALAFSLGKKLGVIR